MLDWVWNDYMQIFKDFYAIWVVRVSRRRCHISSRGAADKRVRSVAPRRGTPCHPLSPPSRGAVSPEWATMPPSPRVSRWVSLLAPRGAKDHIVCFLDSFSVFRSG